MKHPVVALSVALVCLLAALYLPNWNGESRLGVPGSEPTVVSSEPEDQFVGTATCAECHSGHHSSWLMTTHSKAMNLVDTDREPADGTFLHTSSGRMYRSERRGKELWHAEAAIGDEKNSVEARLMFLVGSGRHSRTYLTEFDGFLSESPLTWYASSGKWSMSPGYDHPQHQGFERPVDAGCLVCHCGQIEEVDGAFSHLKLGEMAIGCERCHGPGGRHVELRRNLAQSRSNLTAEDPIVNPSKLTRDLQDDLCAQCHLRGDATVMHAGKRPTDYVAGRSLNATRIDWFLSDSSGQMKVVGHSDQMVASRCWQKSEKLTCTTCHQLHQEQTGDRTEQLQTFRKACLNCHDVDACGETVSARQQVSPADNCASCHMPQVDTDIPHIAFTHHRIGVHEQENLQTVVPASSAELLPFGDVSHLPKDTVERSYALACAEFSSRAPNAELAAMFRQRAVQRLSTLLRSPSVDGEVPATLARLLWESGDLRGLEQMAALALKDPELSSGGRVNALFIQGDTLLNQRRFKDAEVALLDLTKRRRTSEDWLLLGLVRFQAGDQQAGLAAVEKAASIQPFRTDIPETLRKMKAASEKSPVKSP